jgi:hypothetical protein
MHLYKLKFSHYAPKDEIDGMFGYIVAKDEDFVMSYMVEKGYTYWELDEQCEFDGNDEETWAEVLMREKGDFWDDDLADAYYGETRAGWEDMGEVSEKDIEILKRLNVIEAVQIPKL